MQTTSRKQLGSRIDSNLNLSRYTSGLGVIRVEAALKIEVGNSLASASGIKVRAQRLADNQGNHAADSVANRSPLTRAHSGFGIIKQNPATRSQIKQPSA